MRVQRSLASIAKQTTKTLARKIVTTTVFVAVISGGVLFGQNLLATPQSAHALTPPDSCFAISGTTTLTITSYYNNESNNSANPACPKAVDIPATIGGVTVTSIGANAFASKQLTSVTVPSTVTSIGNNAFFNNLIASLTLPNSVTSIGTSAFYSNRLTSLVIPNNLTIISNNAFSYNQLTSLTIPSSVTSIGASAFLGSELTSVTIPSSVTVIGDSAFRTNQLTSVIIPSSVTQLGNTAFADNQMTSVTVAGSPASIGTNVIKNNPIQSISYNGTNYPVSAGTTQPSDACFDFSAGTITGYELDNLALLRDTGAACVAYDITIPSTIGGVAVTAIGDSAFSGDRLTAIVIPTSVTSIGASTFTNNSLTSLVIPTSVTTVGGSAFSGNKLASVTIPGSLTTIGNSVFSSNQLTSVTLPAGVTTVGDYAFSSNSLLTSFTFSNTVTTIGSGVFQYDSLTSITIPGSVTSIGNNAFDNNKLTSVNLSSGLTSIGENAFSSNRLASVVIPSGVTSIGDYAFMANSIVSVVVPSSLTSIGDSAFVMQNPWGGDLTTNGVSGVPYVYSSDPTVVQQAYDNIWYVRLYTADPANPDNLTDNSVSEGWFDGYDANSNGTEADSIGGYIVNPARVTVNALDQNGNALQSPSYITGVKTDGTLLTDYKVVNSGNFAPLDPFNPTPTEQTAMTAGFAQYYRIGQSLSVDAPVIAGQTLSSPSSPTTVTLTAGDTAADFRYGVPATSPSGAGSSSAGSAELANTGESLWVPLAIASLMMIGGTLAITLVLRRQKNR